MTLKLAVKAGPGTGKSYTGTGLCSFMRAADKNRWLDSHQHTQEQKEIWDTCYQAFKGDLPENPKILYASYNRDIVPEISKKVPSKGFFAPKVSTIHGAGASALKTKYGYLQINGQRAYQIVSKLTGKAFHALPDKYAWLCATKYVAHLKDELLEPTPENLERLKLKYPDLTNMAIMDDTPHKCRQLIKAMKNIDRALGIEYMDQVWLPLFFIKRPIYDVGIIDECQDMSPARFLLCKKLCRHLYWTGDPDQSINAFAGADTESFDKIAAISNEVMPLSLSFRCPPNIVRKANRLMRDRIIPDTTPRVSLRAHKTEDGPETAITLRDFATKFEGTHWASHMIMCRTNAPLLQAATQLLQQGIPCFVYGKSIIKEFMSLVKSRNAIDLDDLIDSIERWKERSCEEAKEYMKEFIKDKAYCIITLAKMAPDLDSLEEVMKDVIRENKNDSVQLCTIHKAKGKESKYTHCLYPPVTSPFAESDEQKQQEQNLEFVMMTRTMYHFNEIHKD